MSSKIRPDMLIGLSIAYSIATFFKLNGIVGLWGASFSWTHIALPLAGAFCGLAGSSLLIGGFAAARLFAAVCGMGLYSFFGIPTVCASLYWATESRIARSAIPALCMALFIMHPVGFQAAPYALYWLIPIVISFVPLRNSFLTALGSTFTAHAVGSVMHLYMFNVLSSAAWLQLIPVVAVERLCLAFGMCLVYEVLHALAEYSKTRILSASARVTQ